MTDKGQDNDKIHDSEKELDYDEFEKCAYKLPDDLSLPRATIDPKLLLLQKEVTEFVTSVILKHEMEFYNFVEKNFPTKKNEILGSTNPNIIKMITEITNKFYNKIYHDIQHKFNTPINPVIFQMCDNAGYGPHILLDKLIRLTIDAHIDVVREKLVIQKNNLDIYQKSVLNQINIYLLSKNLLHILSKGDDDDQPFVDLPPGQKAFDIIIDKNIEPEKYLQSVQDNEDNCDKIVFKNTLMQ